MIGLPVLSESSVEALCDFLVTFIQTIGSLAIIYTAVDFHKQRMQVHGIWIELDTVRALPAADGTYDCTVRLSNTSSADLTMLYCAASGIAFPEHHVLADFERSIPAGTNVTFELHGCTRDACVWLGYLSRSDVQREHFRAFQLFPGERKPHLTSRSRSIIFARHQDRKATRWRTGDELSATGNGKNRVWVPTSKSRQSKREILDSIARQGGEQLHFGINANRLDPYVTGDPRDAFE